MLVVAKSSERNTLRFGHILIDTSKEHLRGAITRRPIAGGRVLVVLYRTLISVFGYPEVPAPISQPFNIVTMRI